MKLEYAKFQNYSHSLWPRGLIWEFNKTDRQKEGRHVKSGPCVTSAVSSSWYKVCEHACMFTKCPSIWPSHCCKDAINPVLPQELILYGCHSKMSRYHCASPRLCVSFKLLMTLYNERWRLFLKCASEMGQIISVQLSLRC